MYIARVPNRSSPPAILLRESYRVGGQVKTRTLANLSRWSEAKIQALSRVLKDEPSAAPAERFEIERALPHGHIAAVLGMARKLGLDRLLPHRPTRLAQLALAMIVARVVAPAAKLATARQLSPATAAHSLGAVLDLGAVDEDELYLALDLLLAAQPKVETALARRHLKDGCLVLYDLTSSYLEGRRCPLAHHGYSRDGKPGKLQILFGLLCAADGCPVAVEVFDGNLGDPATLAAQVEKLKGRFRLSRVVLVGDRGMITQARIAADLKPAGLDWLTALRARRRSRLWPRADRCSSPCSITGTWARSNLPITQASASSCAAIRRWRLSGGASAPSCWPPPRTTSPPSPLPWRARAGPCAAAPKSPSERAPCSIAARWPSTSR